MTTSTNCDSISNSVARSTSSERLRSRLAYPIVFVFQLLSNGILTGRGVVVYDPGKILGLRIAYAPVEDLLFGFALVLITLSLWIAVPRRRSR